MKINALMLLILAFLATACAHTERDPASVDKEADRHHRQFQHGYFDKQY